MSLVTRCPRCKTLYRVLPAQLQARAGQVRCGRCRHVFDGFGDLSSEQPAPAVPFESDAADAKAAAAPPASAGTAAVSEPAPASEFVGPPRPSLATRMRIGTAARGRAMRERYLRSPSLAARHAALAVLLVALLAVQVAYAFRSPLAARYPAFKAMMLDVCEIAGCGVWLPHRSDLLQKIAEDVSALDPARPGLIQVTVTMRSGADFHIAYPALDLVLTNANEHALARRIFLPEEYLGSAANPQAGIPPKGEVTLALDLDTGDLNATGFRIDLLPAPVR